VNNPPSSPGSSGAPIGSLAKSLLAAYVLLFVVCGIAPYGRSIWFAENLPIVLIVIAVVWVVRLQARRGTPLSATALVLMSVLPILHTIGGHYTFERVPFGFVTDLFGFERNHYDRLAHFSVGFYAFGIAELMRTRHLVNTPWLLYLFPIFTIFTIAGVYEVFEWRYAVMADESAGIAVLGSQGDIWDAQKDILADGLGAFVAMAMFRCCSKYRADSV
jgi:putative membrane protein